MCQSPAVGIGAVVLGERHRAWQGTQRWPGAPAGTGVSRVSAGATYEGQGPPLLAAMCRRILVGRGDVEPSGVFV